MASQSLSKQDVKKIKQSIRKINDWNITPTKHIDQMMSQRNFAIRDVINVLINGRLKKSREFDEKNLGWKYTIVGKDIDGKKLAVVFTINEDEKILILITAFRG